MLQLRRLRCAAFTLIELLVTIVILSTGIVVILRAFESSVVALGESREVLYGTMLAREKLASVEAELEEGTPPTSNSSGWFEEDYENYRWSLRSSQVASVDSAVDDEGDTSLYEVEVAAWRDGRDERQTVSTYLRY